MFPFDDVKTKLYGTMSSVKDMIEHYIVMKLQRHVLVPFKFIVHKTKCPFY